MSADPSTVIRIAIVRIQPWLLSSLTVPAQAFVALKHKPREQSTACEPTRFVAYTLTTRLRARTAYILDLQSQFPLLEINDETVPSQPPDATNKWRAHALELEKQLKVLQEKRDVDQEGMSCSNDVQFGV